MDAVVEETRQGKVWDRHAAMMRRKSERKLAKMAKEELRISQCLVKRSSEGETLEDIKARNGKNALNLLDELMEAAAVQVKTEVHNLQTLTKAISVIGAEGREWLGIRNIQQAAPQVHLVNRISVISGHGAVPSVIDSVQEDNVT